MAHFIVDSSRWLLMILWALVAWRLHDFRGLPMQARALRGFAVLLASLYTVFYLSFNLGTHLDWSLAWHNEASRFLSYMTVALFLVWAFLGHTAMRREDR